MMTIAFSHSDRVIFTGMFITIVFSIYQALYACWLSAAKGGVLLSAVAICLGLAYFGWQPLFGGSHSISTYFGSVILFVGGLSMLLFITIDQSYRHKIDNTPGFPVIFNEKTDKTK
jgi:hypothetical protein